MVMSNYRAHSFFVHDGILPCPRDCNDQFIEIRATTHQKPGKLGLAIYRLARKPVAWQSFENMPSDGSCKIVITTYSAVGERVFVFERPTQTELDGLFIHVDKCHIPVRTLKSECFGC